MEPKGKGMVVNDKEKESLFNEPRDDKPTDSGSSHKKRAGRRRGASRRSSTMTAMPPRLHQGMTTTTTHHPKERRIIKTIHLITPAFRIIQMPIYFLFLLENPHTLMERITHFGAIKCVVTYFYLHPSIWEIVENGMHFDSTDNHVLVNE
jgi:hypothetical protein